MDGTECGPCNPTSAVESGSNSVRVAAVRGRWTTRHPARPSASALPQQKKRGRRVREDGLCFESGIEPLYYSQVCAVKSQFRMRLWDLQLKTAADTRCFKNWMYVLVVIIVQFRVVNSWIKREKYCTGAQFACRVEELCSKNFVVAFLRKTSVVFLSAEGLDWVFRRFTNPLVFLTLSLRNSHETLSSLSVLRTTWRVCIICSYSTLKVILVPYFTVSTLILCC